MKQETLEEVAENYKINIIKSGRSHRVEYTKQIKLDFIAGVKSDAARDYWLKEFKQDKNKYSEEEVQNILIEYVKTNPTKPYRVVNWFEQFKKK